MCSLQFLKMYVRKGSPPNLKVNIILSKNIQLSNLKHSQIQNAVKNKGDATQHQNEQTLNSVK